MIRQRGFIVKGDIELWCDDEMIKKAPFVTKEQRQEIISRWDRQIKNGDLKKGKCNIIVKPYFDFKYHNLNTLK